MQGCARFNYLEFYMRGYVVVLNSEKLPLSYV